MTISLSYFDTATMLGVMQEQEPASNYWLNLLFGRQLNFTTEYIDFEKISEKRKLAPFVSPAAQGRPTYRAEGSSVTRLKPAYIKPKDPVRAVEMMGRKPGNLVGPVARSPEQNFQAAVADILRFHRTTIERRWEWLAAQAIIYGAVTIADDDSPERVVDFARPNGHTVVSGPGETWDVEAHDIIGDIETWRDTVRRAPFGGPVNRLTVGSEVWPYMRANEGLMKQLDTQVRGTNANFQTGIREMLDVEFVGNIGGNLDVFVYNDYYTLDDGTAVPFMSSKDVVLTGPGVEGVRCFGAIMDKAAGFQALPIFPKMWDVEDPSATFIMSQSAPLMVPVNPENTLRATVLADEE